MSLINPIGGLFAAGLIAMSSMSAIAVESTTWLDWVAAKNSGTVPNMPDFSYAGYQSGNVAIPDPNYPIFDVSSYGAIANDDNDDSSAIQAAIDAAEANGQGIVLLQKGRYHATGLTVNGSNIIIRGQGALDGGTELFSVGTPTAGGGTIITIRPTSTGNKSDVTAVTGNIQRDTFNVQVADSAGVQVGQLVSLYSRDPNANLLADFFAPFTPAGSETLSSGVEVNERHVISAINGNTLTFATPINYDVDAQYNWTIRKAGSYLTEVGLEDLALVGNFSDDTTFVHHRNTLDDEGWKGAVLTHVRDSWVRRVRIVNTNHGIDVNSGVNVSLLELILEGNNGHHGVLVNSSTRTLIGLVQERNIWEHPAGQTGHNSANVFWRYDAREVMELDNHGKYGYATLRDVMSAHSPGNGSGSAIQSPRHLRFYTLWNYQYKYLGSAAAQQPHNFWESIFSSIVQPIVVGYQAPDGLLVAEAEDVAATDTPKPVYPTMQINESYGSAVTPYSLYEAQVEYRTGNLPAWINDAVQSWTLFSNTTVTIDPLLDNSVNAPGADIQLSATVPSEISNDVARVEFVHGGNVLATATTAPYKVTWSAPPQGTYTVQARVVRHAGEVGTSTPVNIFVGVEATAALPVTIIQALTDAGSTATELDTQPSSNLIDGDLNSYWVSNASKRKPNDTRTPQSIDFDLGSIKAVNRVDIAWTQGLSRADYLRVHVSEDNVNWTEVLRTVSSATTNALETYYFDASPARFVRVIGFTNSVSRDTQISEIALFEDDQSSGPFVATQGISFDGIDDYIELADIDYGSSQRITLAMWLKFTTPASTAYILRKADTSSNNPYYIQVASNGKISARVNGINGGGIAGLDDNQWHHFAMTYQGSSSYLRTYKDGVLVASNTTATAPTSNNFLATLGGSAKGNLMFAGSIDDVRIYDRKLSSDEIAQLAALPHLDESAPCTPVTDTNLQGFWPMADGGINQTCDVSGNGNHGTLVSGPSWN